MADKKATPPAKKTLSKKAMKSTKGCGIMVPDALPTTTTDLSCRKAGGDGQTY